jgi:hypothetical protein
MQIFPQIAGPLCKTRAVPTFGDNSSENAGVTSDVGDATHLLLTKQVSILMPSENSYVRAVGMIAEHEVIPKGVHTHGGAIPGPTYRRYQAEQTPSQQTLASASAKCSQSTIDAENLTGHPIVFGLK